jgi:hypothetical protein
MASFGQSISYRNVAIDVRLAKMLRISLDWLLLPPGESFIDTIVSRWYTRYQISKHL